MNWLICEFYIKTVVWKYMKALITWKLTYAEINIISYHPTLKLVQYGIVTLRYFFNLSKMPLTLFKFELFIDQLIKVDEVDQGNASKNVKSFHWKLTVYFLRYTIFTRCFKMFRIFKKSWKQNSGWSKSGLTIIWTGFLLNLVEFHTSGSQPSEFGGQTLFCTIQPRKIFSLGS